MAGEKKIKQSEPVAAGVTSDSYTQLAEQNVAPRKDGVPSDSTSSISSSEDVTSGVKGETDQASIAEQGYNGTFTQADDYFSSGGCSYTDVRSANGSPLYDIPGYNPYATVSLMGVDGKQSHKSTPKYLQHSISHGSKASTCYTSGSTYVGNVTNETPAESRDVKSTLVSNVPVKNFNSSKTNDTLSNKASILPLNSRSRQSTALYNLSKPILRTQPLKYTNKFGSGFQSTGPVKNFYPVGKFSAFSNQNQSLRAHNSVMNYGQNERAWNGNNRFESQTNSGRNEVFETSTELTCGPRARSGNNPSNPREEDKKDLLTVQRDQYNLEDFQTQYDNAKFYVIKSFSEDDIHKSIKYDVWSSTPNSNKKLDAAYHDAEAKASETSTKCPIFLFFSVNRSGQFVGLAEMVGRVDFNKNMDFWQLDKWNGFFPVKWHIIKDIPNFRLQHIILESNDNRAVTYSRDAQEIELKQGCEMLNIFKSYSSKTSLLDDLSFYENREKSLKTRRSSKPASETELHKNSNTHKHFKAAERIIEESVKTTSSDHTSSLIHLTKNMSLNSHPFNNPREKSMPSNSAQWPFMK